jgi:hypothetical protein
MEVDTSRSSAHMVDVWSTSWHPTRSLGVSRRGSGRLGPGAPGADRSRWDCLAGQSTLGRNQHQFPVRSADRERGGVAGLKRAQDVGDLFAIAWNRSPPADHHPLANIGGGEPDLVPVAHAGHRLTM